MLVSYAEDLFPPLSLLEPLLLPQYIQEHHSIIHSAFPFNSSVLFNAHNAFSH
jgi:hypothetical protein